MGRRHYTIGEDIELVARVEGGAKVSDLCAEYGIAAYGMRLLIGRARERIAIYPLTRRAINVLRNMGDDALDPDRHSGKPTTLYLSQPNSGIKTVAIISAWLEHTGRTPLYNDVVL